MDDELVFVGVIFTVVIAVVIGMTIWAASVSCGKSAAQNEVEYRWGAMSGCSFQHPETKLWVPAQNYRAVGD